MAGESSDDETGYLWALADGESLFSSLSTGRMDRRPDGDLTIASLEEAVTRLCRLEAEQDVVGTREAVFRRMVASGLSISKTPHVPLVDRDGNPLLCWRVDNAILVHPERWEEFWIYLVDIGGAQVEFR